MIRRFASLTFVAACSVLVLPLAAQVISPTMSGALLAVALVTLGLGSRGFQKT